jgi:hypothetical protein
VTHLCYIYCFIKQTNSCTNNKCIFIVSIITKELSPIEFFGYDANDENTFVICARVGLLDEAINIAKMCHVVRNTFNGAEMRTRFWLGHVAKRQGNKTIASLPGFIGNTALARLLVLDKKSAEGLKRHAMEEMIFLAELLPSLYESQKQDKG